MIPDSTGSVDGLVVGPLAVLALLCAGLLGAGLLGAGRLGAGLLGAGRLGAGRLGVGLAVRTHRGLLRWSPRRLGHACLTVLGATGIVGLLEAASAAPGSAEPTTAGVLSPHEEPPSRLQGGVDHEPHVVIHDDPYPIVTDSGEIAPSFWPVGGEPPVRNGSPTSPNRTVVVHRGDSLWSLAAHQLPADASASAILQAVYQWYRLNRQVVGPDPDLILPGQILRIPVTTEAGGARPNP